MELEMVLLFIFLLCMILLCAWVAIVLNKRKDEKEKKIITTGNGPKASCRIVTAYGNTKGLCINYGMGNRIITPTYISSIKYDEKEDVAYLRATMSLNSGIVTGRFQLQITPENYKDFLGFVDNYEKAEKKNREEIDRQLAKEREKQKIARIREEIITFASENGVMISYDYLDSLYSAAVRASFVSQTCAPIAPLSTRGAVRGSFADNISSIANAQKQAKYDADMEYIRQTADRAIESKIKYSSVASEIEFKLRDIPNSEEYVEKHIEYCNYYQESMRKV